MTIYDINNNEALYACKQSQQLRGCTGEIGNLNITFNGEQRVNCWNDYHSYQHTSEFDGDYQGILSQLIAKDGNWMLNSRNDFLDFASAHPNGVRIDTDSYSYLMRFNTQTCSADMYCYKKDSLNRHIKEASSGIRMKYGTKEVVVPDGAKVKIDYHDGNEPTTRQVRYVDSTHFELDGSSLGLYHRDEYADILNEKGATIAPVKEKMTVVICSPGQEARIAEIGTSLEDMQQAVGGYIEPYYFSDDKVAIICNDEGKFNGMRPCRAVYDPDGGMQDIVFGRFFIVGVGDEDFCSLSPALANKYAEQFQHAERFYRVDESTIIVEPIIAPTRGKSI